jgi:hypothetical protein
MLPSSALFMVDSLPFVSDEEKKSFKLDPSSPPSTNPNFLFTSHSRTWFSERCPSGWSPSCRKSKPEREYWDRAYETFFGAIYALALAGIAFLACNVVAFFIKIVQGANACQSRVISVLGHFVNLAFCQLYFW